MLSDEKNTSKQLVAVGSWPNVLNHIASTVDNIEVVLLGMKHTCILLACMLVLGAGCTQPSPQPTLPVEEQTEVPVVEPDVVPPLDFTGTAPEGATYKRFGEYFQDRFRIYFTSSNSISNTNVEFAGILGLGDCAP